MKSKVLLLVSSIILSTTAFAQKEELKTLKKIYAREKTSDSDMAEFKATLTKAESLVANSTEDDKVYFAFYKAMAPVLEMNLVMSKPENLNNPALLMKYLTVDNVNQLVTNLIATLDFEKKSGKQVYTKDIEETITSFKPMLVNFAIALANNSNFKEAAVVLHSIYELDKKDVEKLYYSANYAVNSKDYDLALKYYQELKVLNYTGAEMAYYAFNKETQKEDAFTVGEWFKFRIHYGVLNAGYATVEVKEAALNHKKVFHVVGKGYTTGMSRFFFKRTTFFRC